MFRPLAIAAALLLLTEATAAAQLRPFVMSGLADESGIGLDTGIGFSDPATVAHADLVADLRVSRLVAVFGRFPLVIADTEQSTGLGIGNVTVGWRYYFLEERSGATRYAFAHQGSVSLPSASDSGDGGVAANENAFFYAPYCPGWYGNETTLRLGGDFLVETARLFFQAGLAAHIYFEGEEVAMRLGLAAGVNVSSTIALVGEFSMLTVFDEGTFDALDLGARWQSGANRFGARFTLPLHSGARDASAFGVGFDFRHLF